MSTNPNSITFEESSIPQMYVEYVRDRWAMGVPIDFVTPMYRAMFSTFATLLKYQRNKNNPHIGFKLLNSEGEFIIGVILDYHAPETEDDDTGNWTLSFTFNEADMADLSTVYDNFSDMFYTIANQEVHAAFFGTIETQSAATDLFVAMIEVLKNQLDALANTSNEVEIEMPGIFLASVGFEDGQKVYSIVPGHNIKQQIKDDKGLSKAA